MRTANLLIGCSMIAALVLAAPAARAQSATPFADPFAREDAPRFVAAFGPQQVLGLERELEEDFRSLGAFGGKRRIDRFTTSTVERPMPWRFYGRLGLLNFQNDLEDTRSNMRITLRRTGPRLSGRVYIGVHRTFH
ncbi:MAG TPA: hypothetical protein VM489_03150 [Burkholderiales bacterium]|nr:hypothetical protein [Burkholderiales bacterium]